MSRAGDDRPAPAVILVVDGSTAAAVELVSARATAERGVVHAVVPADAVPTALSGLAADRVVVVLAAGWLAPATVYGDLVADPRPAPAVLHDENGGVVGVRTGDPASLTRAISGLGEPTADGLLDALAAGLRSGGGPVREVGPGAFPTTWIGDDLESARAVTDAADEAALRLRRASRSDDGFLSAFLIRPLSRRVTRRVVRTAVAPAQITGVSLVLGIASAAAYAGGARGWLALGSLLLLVSLVVDCVDGEVARHTRTFSALGGWLDVASDRVKEYAVYAALVVGVGHSGGRDLWPLALASMTVLVTRHFVDFGFAASSGAAAAGSTVAQWSAATSRRPALMWAKRAVIMPVGERTVLLVVVVPLLGARVALWVLFAWGLVAGAYTTAGRVGRAWRSPAAGDASVVVGRLVGQCDVGPLARWPVTGRLGWLWPALCRLVEALGVVGLAAWAGGADLLPGAYAVLAVGAFRLYDVVYRQRLGAAVRTEDGLARVGWPARVVVVGALAAVGAGAGTGPAGAALVGSAGVFGLLALAASARWWRAQPRGATAP